MNCSFIILQGGGTPIYPALRSLSSVKVEVKSQAKNLQLVKGQTWFRNCIPRSILLKYEWTYNYKNILECGQKSSATFSENQGLFFELEHFDWGCTGCIGVPPSSCMASKGWKSIRFIIYGIVYEFKVDAGNVGQGVLWVA